MNCETVLQRARRVRALVVGDICLDRWCHYDPALAEPSRETGIPRHGVVRTRVSPGAGGTVAANLASLGTGTVSVLGAVGCDGFAHELRHALAGLGIEHGLLVDSEELQTFTYTKLLNGETGTEDLARVDFINASALAPSVEDRLVSRFLGCVEGFDVVVVADQAETSAGGVVTPGLRSTVCDEARRRPGTVFVADSRERIELFRHVVCTPNREEADAACKRALGCVDYGELYRVLAGPALIVTAGSQGAWLVDRSGARLVPASGAGPVVDSCGAGDSLAAGLALARACGAPLETALRFGIIVAGITVRKAGTGCASPREVLAEARRIRGRE